jgi:signal transduction histidine kinase
MQRAERLASLGMISATLAHELAQPLTVAQLATQNALAELEKLTCPDIVKHDLQAGLAAARESEIIGRFRASPAAREAEIEYVSWWRKRPFGYWSRAPGRPR